MDHNPYVQLSYNVVPDGGTGGTIYVTLLNPAGFRDLSSSTTNSSLVSNLNIKLVYFNDGGTVLDAQNSFSIRQDLSYYIGLDGTELALDPELKHLSEL